MFDINLDNVPKRNINNWLNNAAKLNNNSSRVIIDKLVNTGGNVKMSKTPSSKKASVYLPEFDAYTEYKDAVNVNYEDVWDIQPLSSPGRSPLSRIEIMGTKPFVKEIPNPNNPFGTDIEYRKFLLPDLWKDIEAGKILRGKPFTVKNTIEALEGIDLDGPYITPLSDTNVKSIPKYQDGKGKVINKADLPPEYRTGTPVDENMILEYMRNPTSNKMVKNQYDLYRNKNEYIDRLNKLIPMEILMPLGGAGFVGHELNKE